MLRFIVLLLLFAFSTFAKDKSVVVFYFCGLEGSFLFDENGSGGLATLSSLKNQEKEKLSGGLGISLLLAGENFFPQENLFSQRILQKSNFDGLFLSEKELVSFENYLEENPSFKRFYQPYFIASRDNFLIAPQEKSYNLGDVSLILRSTFPELKQIRSPFVYLIFPNSDHPVDFAALKKSGFPAPVVFFTPRENSNQYHYKKNIHVAYCPSGKMEVGKLSLTFRGDVLIGLNTYMIKLNTSDSNKSWIHPDRETLKELQ